MSLLPFANAPIRKYSPVFNVIKYGGAKGDGTTDDKAAIDTTITAAQAVDGTIDFTGAPSGSYLTSGGHIIYGNVVYELGWSTINLKNSSNTDVFVAQNFATNTGTNNTTDPANFQIRNGFINGNKANQSGTSYGIRLYAHNYIMQNVFVTNCLTDDFYSEWGNVGTLTPPTNNMESKIVNCKFSSAGGWGINFLGPHDSRFIGCESYSNTTGNIRGAGNAAGTKWVNCHEYLTTTVGVSFETITLEWIEGVAEVTSPGVAVKLLGNENRIIGGYVIDPNIGATTGIQIGDGTHTPQDCKIDTTIQTTDTAAINFSNSGGNNSVKAKIYQTGGTLITGSPALTDNVTIEQGSEVAGIATGNLPQTNGSTVRMMLPDPQGTATWYKLGTWFAGNGTGGGDRLRIVINGTGGYNADIASAGRTVITCSTGNAGTSPNIQGVFYAENGSPLTDNVKAKFNTNSHTWDIYIHLLATYMGNCNIVVDTGTEKYASTFIYSLASGSDPGVASSTVAVFTEQFSITSPVVLNGSEVVTGTLTVVNGVTTLGNELHVNANMIVNNSASNVGAGIFVGKSDGSQYTNFILADNVYPLDQNPGGHYWAFSHRTTHHFLIFNYNGAGTYTNVLDIDESGNQTIKGNVSLSVAGNKLKIATGTNASAGTGTLSSGTVTISTTAVTASSLIFITDTSSGSTNVGTLRVSAQTANTSFVVTSSNVLDASTFNWLIIN